MLNQQLIIGSTYRVKFKGVFERHGVCTTSGLTCLHKGNGTFKLDGISTFRALMTKGVKLYDVFFKPLGISENEYRQYYNGKPADEFTPEYDVKKVSETGTEMVLDPSTNQIVQRSTTTDKEVYVETGRSILTRHAADSVNYANYPVYTFIDVVDPDDVIYAPALTIDEFPEIEIGEYKDLTLCFHLGYFDKPHLLDPMLLAIRERLTVYGVKPKHIKLYSTGSKWLNPDEYKAIQRIRVPADVEVVPEDALFDDYKDRRVIGNGEVRNLVETEADITAAINAATTPEAKAEKRKTLISFESIKSKTIRLSKNLFLTDIDENDVFNGVSVYYEVQTDESLLELNSASGVVCQAGKPVMNIVEKPSSETTPVSGKQYFTQTTTYKMIPYNADRSTYGELYVHTITTPEGGSPTESYELASETQRADTGLVLYTKHDKFVKATVSGSFDSSTTYYVSEPRTTAGTGVYKYENYAAVAALQYIGDKFTYINVHGQEKYVTNLTLADIIDFTSNVVLRGIKLAASTYSNYVGLVFRVTDASGKATYYPITEANKTTILALTGDVLGQTGVLSRETNFLKEDVVDRNYYFLYRDSEKRNEELMAQNAALQRKLQSLLPPLVS